MAIWNFLSFVDSLHASGQYAGPVNNPDNGPQTFQIRVEISVQSTFVAK